MERAPNRAQRFSGRAALAGAVVAAACLLHLALADGGRAPAQENPAQQVDAPPVPEDARERVLRYLDSAVFIRPGTGVGDLVLGMPLAQVVERWGRPAASERSGIVNRRTTLLYRAGTSAWIAVSGDETVEEIGIEGRTTLATPEGVRYGMPRHQVSMIYGEPVETEAAGYLYPERGIGFTFRSGTVFQVELFAPRKREEG